MGVNRLRLSKIERVHGPIQYFCPLQSWSQFVRFAPTYIGGLLLVWLVAEGLMPNSWRSYVLIGAALGGTAPLFWNLPYLLVLSTGNAEARLFVNDISGELIRYGYAGGVSEGGVLRFVIPGPTWLYWPESALILRSKGSTIEMRGPGLVLSRLSRFLERDLGAQHA